MVDINKLYEVYIVENTNIDRDKSKILENFRKVEGDFKYYTDILATLEKEKNKSKIDSYKKLSEEIINRLKIFNPNLIEVNIPPVNKEILYLREIREDVFSVSQKFKHIQNMWSSFIERNKNLDFNSVFVKNIFESIQVIKKEFEEIDLNDLSRIEENIIDLNRSIERSISMIEKMKLLLKDFDFIGKEPKELERKIIDFINEGYKNMTLVEINVFYKDIEEDIEFYKRERVLKRIKARVIRLRSKENMNIYNYGIEINNHLIIVAEKLSSNTVKEDTDEFLYIENFPIYGIVPLKDIQENIEVADDQFYAIKELNDLSHFLFIVLIISAVIILSSTISGTTSPIITVPLVILLMGLFTFLFNGIKYRINSKYKLRNMFYFFKINYFFTKIGDDGLDIQKVVPRILENFSKVVSHNVSREPSKNKKVDKKESKKVDKKESKKVDKKESKKKSVIKKINFNKLKNNFNVFLRESTIFIKGMFNKLKGSFIKFKKNIKEKKGDKNGRSNNNK